MAPLVFWSRSLKKSRKVSKSKSHSLEVAPVVSSFVWRRCILQNDNIMISWDFFQADSTKVSWHGCWCRQPEKISWYCNIIDCRWLEKNDRQISIILVYYSDNWHRRSGTISWSSLRFKKGQEPVLISSFPIYNIPYRTF